MGRIINTESTGKKRNQLMRTSAEILRRLSQKQNVDDDVKDMIAMLVYCLREINAGIDQSAAAWEKRDYWMKAEEFRQRWFWVSEISDELETMLRNEEWQQLPKLLVKLLPKFSEIKVTKLTRNPTLWKGCYHRLLQEQHE
ncbi:MAG: hypothetical protein D6737_00725 [Chloroflexi bacterium]|nr:MAG: hypothetical protein CUN54_04505 [Phototrophicales bacterium]RMF82786.1 MAG: hypothetical protein D6737_00725 [Chloroflexota bacterium]